MDKKEYIDLAFETEKLHRYVFEKIYVQNYVDLDEADEAILNTYKELCEKCPDFRKVLWDASQKDNTGRFKEIKFARYGFRN